MSDDTWNDEARSDLRESITSYVLGQLRLAKSDPEELLEDTAEYLLDEVPEDEHEAFLEFIRSEKVRLSAEYESSKAAWPEVTDCDRLDRAEARLRKDGILLWQASPCCDTCSGAEIPDRLDEIESKEPGFRSRCRGYAFFHDQNLPEELGDNTEIPLYLAFGWLGDDDRNLVDAEYQKLALGIAKEVCGALRAENLDVDWNGDMNRKIGVKVNWQRRELLE